MPSTTSASRASAFATGRARRADAADGLRVLPQDRALAGLGVGHRDTGGLGEAAQLLGGLAVDHAATGDDQRLARGPQHLRRREPARPGSGAGPADVPDAPGEQLLGPVEASACTSCGSAIVTAPVSAWSVSTRIAAEQGGGQHLRAPHALEEPRQRPEGVAGLDVVPGTGAPAPAAPGCRRGWRRRRWAAAARAGGWWSPPRRR